MDSFIMSRMEDYKQFLVAAWKQQPISVPETPQPCPAAPTPEARFPRPWRPAASSQSAGLPAVPAALPAAAVVVRTPPPKVPAVRETPSPSVAMPPVFSPRQDDKTALVPVGTTINSSNFKKEYNDLMRLCNGKRRPCRRLSQCAADVATQCGLCMRMREAVNARGLVSPQVLQGAAGGLGSWRAEAPTTAREMGAQRRRPSEGP